jgi:hypothetical protein
LHLETPAHIKTQLHIAEILLYEVGIHDDLSACLPTTERLELLWDCLKATRSMLEARFDIPMVDRPRQTCMSSYDYTYAMLTSLRLSTLALPGWDLALVRRELDTGKFLDMQIQEVKWVLERRSGGAWRADEEIVGNIGPTGQAAPSLRASLDPLETLYTRLLQLRVALKAELLAAAAQGEEGAGGQDMLAQAAAQTPGAAAAGEGDNSLVGENQFVADPTLLDFTQDPQDPFWQDMYRVNEWETNFSSLFGWSLDGQGVSLYATPGADAREP